MSTPDTHPLADVFKMIRQCPLCGVAYTPEAAVVIDRREDAQLVHIACISCKTAVVTLVRYAPIGISSIAAMTDLTAADMKRLRHEAPISEDDILSFHRFLETSTNVADDLHLV